MTEMDRQIHATIRSTDPELAAILDAEAEREHSGLELIASENYASLAVRAAQATVLTNKYAEGLPGKRYYGGCAEVDRAERLAQARVQQLFGAEASNVQPHSGSQANMAAYLACVPPGSTILGMSLSHGGHLTHGSPVNFSGRLFKAESYGLDAASDQLDMNQVRETALRVRPALLLAGASAYPRILDFEAFRSIANEVGATFIVDMAHIAGLVAAGLHPSPIAHADLVTSTTHKTLRGPRGGIILGSSEQMKKANSQVFPGIQGGPLMHVIAAKAVAFGEALQPSFHDYQTRVLANAKQLAQELLSRGYQLVTGGTDNHLILVDLTHFGDRTVTGKDAETWLDAAGITVNKNTVPRESRSPFVTSGIRIGVPAATTRGLGLAEMTWLAARIDLVLQSKGLQSPQIREEMRELLRSFPLPR